jgi:hypothetical protein
MWLCDESIMKETINDFAYEIATIEDVNREALNEITMYRRRSPTIIYPFEKLIMSIKDESKELLEMIERHSRVEVDETTVQEITAKVEAYSQKFVASSIHEYIRYILDRIQNESTPRDEAIEAILGGDPRETVNL